MSSVVIKSADRGLIIHAVLSLVAKLRSDTPEIEKVIWFGSWIHGLPTTGSDVDLCLILTDSDKPVRERVADYLPVGFPVGIEIFPYTKEELRELSVRSPGWYQALISGREL